MLRLGVAQGKGEEGSESKNLATATAWLVAFSSRPTYCAAVTRWSPGETWLWNASIRYQPLQLGHPSALG